jgi:hypothetical protein
MRAFQYRGLKFLAVSVSSLNWKSISYLHIRLLALSTVLVRQHIAKQAKSRMRRRLLISTCNTVSWPFATKVLNFTVFSSDGAGIGKAGRINWQWLQESKYG